MLSLFYVRALRDEPPSGENSPSENKQATLGSYGAALFDHWLIPLVDSIEYSPIASLRIVLERRGLMCNSLNSILRTAMTEFQRTSIRGGILSVMGMFHQLPAPDRILAPPGRSQMATVSTSQPKWQHVAAGAYDRIFYSGIAVAMAVTVFIGFAPLFTSDSIFTRLSESGRFRGSPSLK